MGIFCGVETDNDGRVEHAEYLDKKDSKTSPVNDLLETLLTPKIETRMTVEPSIEHLEILT